MWVLLITSDYKLLPQVVWVNFDQGKVISAASKPSHDLKSPLIYCYANLTTQDCLTLCMCHRQALRFNYQIGSRLTIYESHLACFAKQKVLSSVRFLSILIHRLE